MKYVIDIDGNVLTRLFDNGTEDYEISNDDLSAIAKAIRNGTPFPLGVITTDKAIRIIRKYLGYSDGKPYNTVDAIIEDILYASDKEGVE